MKTVGYIPKAKGNNGNQKGGGKPKENTGGKPLDKSDGNQKGGTE